jgi:hypothetical protein
MGSREFYPEFYPVAAEKAGLCAVEPESTAVAVFAEPVTQQGTQ